MADNIVITRIWQDTDFFEVFVACTNANLFISYNYYLNDFHIDDLHTQIQKFLSCENNSVLWESGNSGAEYVPCFKIKISNISKTGTVEMEICMEFIDNEAQDKHNCIFCVKTELGLLEKFSKELLSLKENSIGVKASLFLD